MNKARTLQIKEGVYVQELLEKLSVARDQWKWSVAKA